MKEKQVSPELVSLLFEKATNENTWFQNTANNLFSQLSTKNSNTPPPPNINALALYHPPIPFSQKSPHIPKSLLPTNTSSFQELLTNTFQSPKSPNPQQFFFQNSTNPFQSCSLHDPGSGIAVENSWWNYAILAFGTVCALLGLSMLKRKKPEPLPRPDLLALQLPPAAQGEQDPPPLLFGDQEKDKVHYHRG